MKIFSVLAEDQPGVLDRIAGFMRRNGWNIQEITAGPTSSPNVARVTIKVFSKGISDESFQDRILTMDNILSCDIYAPKEHLLRETALLHLPIGVAEKLPGAVLERSGELAILEYSGDPDQVSAVIAKAQQLGEVEYSRSGVIMIHR